MSNLEQLEFFARLRLALRSSSQQGLVAYPAFRLALAAVGLKEKSPSLQLLKEEILLVGSMPIEALLRSLRIQPDPQNKQSFFRIQYKQKQFSLQQCLQECAEWLQKLKKEGSTLLQIFDRNGDGWVSRLDFQETLTLLTREGISDKTISAVLNYLIKPTLKHVPSKQLVQFSYQIAQRNSLLVRIIKRSEQLQQPTLQQLKFSHIFLPQQEEERGYRFNRLLVRFGPLKERLRHHRSQPQVKQVGDYLQKITKIVKRQRQVLEPKSKDTTASRLRKEYVRQVLLPQLDRHWSSKIESN